MCYHTEPVRETDQRRAPALSDGDNLLFDEPGRCRPMVNGTGSVDYHSHWFRLVEAKYGGYFLLVRHGGGDERFALGFRHTRIAELIRLLPDSDARYLMLHELYAVHSEAQREARIMERSRWHLAAAEGRVRTRKVRGQEQVKVWIEEKV